MATGGDKIIRSGGLLVYRIVDGTINYLMLQASNKKHHWTPPKGHVDPGEDEITAAIRETHEEAGLTASMLKIDDTFKETIFYYCNRDPNQPKTVAWWLAELIDPTAQVILSHEHDDFKWLPLDDATTTAAYDELTTLLRSAEQFLRSRRS